MTQWFKERGDKFIIGLIALLATTVLASLHVISGEFAVSIIMGIAGGTAMAVGGKKLALAGVTAISITAMATGCASVSEATKQKTTIAAKCMVGCAQKCILEVINDPAKCGIETVFGGEIRDDDSVMALASIESKSGKRCSGMLIAETAVLTAAHCVNDENLTVDIWGGKYSIVRKFIHNSADLALIEIDRAPSTIIGGKIKPYVIYGGELSVDERVKILGRGEMKPGDILMLPQAGQTKISAIDEKRIELVGKPGICDGDSGGGLMYGRCLVGIHQARIGECGSNSISIRLSKYLPWILDKLTNG